MTTNDDDRNRRRTNRIQDSILKSANVTPHNLLWHYNRPGWGRIFGDSEGNSGIPVTITVHNSGKRMVRWAINITSNDFGNVINLLTDM